MVSTVVDNKPGFKRCNITINRSCNLRCIWCYARDTNYKIGDDMSKEVFDNVVDFCKTAKVKSVALIGGEPTLYPKIFECIEKLKGFYVSLVTNGLALADKDTAKKYVELGVNSFSISIKAENSIKYKECTGADCFEKVLKAIRNLSDLDANFSASYVITEENADHVKEMVTRVKEAGCEKFFFSFCRNFNIDGDKTYIKNNNPYKVASKFEELMPWLKENVKKLTYSINDPLCAYSNKFLEENIKNFYYPCYVHTNNTITFDTLGNVIPCNTIHQIKLSKIGEDFKTYDELLEIQDSEEYIEIYKKLRGIPSEVCKSCKWFENCLGRCICNWTNYTFENFKKMKNE